MATRRRQGLGSHALPEGVTLGWSFEDEEEVARGRGWWQGRPLAAPLA